MLLQRVLTALLLLPLLLAAVWFAPTPWLYTLFCGVGLLMAWEWAGLMGLAARRSARWAYVLVAALALAMAWYLPQREALLPWLLGAAAVWWFAVPVIFPGFPGNFERRRPGLIAMSLLGLLLLLSTMLALARLHAMPEGQWRLLYCLFVVFAADTGAYFAGRAFGRHKLAPNISPGKTIEGAVGGLLLCTVLALVAGPLIFKVEGSRLAVLMALTIGVAFVSIIGDLVESLFKRAAGVKDSGTLLPGHGGILDRIDSILAAAPVMTLGLLLTGL